MSFIEQSESGHNANSIQHDANIVISPGGYPAPINIQPPLRYIGSFFYIFFLFPIFWTFSYSLVREGVFWRFKASIGYFRPRSPLRYRFFFKISILDLIQYPKIGKIVFWAYFGWYSLSIPKIGKIVSLWYIEGIP